MNTMNTALRIVGGLVLLVSMMQPTPAQESRGTLTGQVIDASRASVAGAAITVRNTRTGIVNQASSNTSGYYTVPYLLPGEYEVSCSAPGFKSYLRQGIRMTAAAEVNLAIELEVGNVVERVTVEADAPLLETTTATLGGVVDSRRVADLPTLKGSSLLMLRQAPGIQVTNQSAYTNMSLHDIAYQGDVSAAGGQGLAHISLDGAPNTGSGVRVQHVPHIEAVQEVKVETSSFDVTEGMRAGAFVNLVTKSGTNDFHGTLSATHWQNRWNATPSPDNAAYWKAIYDAEAAGDFAKSAQLRATPKQQSGRSTPFAATVGGPVMIPKVFSGQNSLFFFYSLNGYNDRSPDAFNNRRITVPTADERNGDFSRLLAYSAAKYQIYDPLTTRFNSQQGRFVRDPFVGNRIPQSRHINPAYRQYERLFPAPNNPPTMDAEGNYNFYSFDMPSKSDYLAHQGRIDYSLNTKNRFFFRFNTFDFDRYTNDWTYNSVTGLMAERQIRTTKAGALDYLHTFNSTMILNVVAGFTEFKTFFNNRMQYDSLPSEYGLPTYIDNYVGDRRTIPSMDIKGYRRAGARHSFPSRVQIGNMKSSLSKYAGNHSLQFGWEGRQYVSSGTDEAYTAGLFTFSNNLLRKDSSYSGAGQLGLGWAAFLMGIPDSAAIDLPTSTYVTTPSQSFYGQVKSRITSRFTLTLGLRGEYVGSIKERFNQGIRNFDPSLDVSIASASMAAYAASPIPEVPVSSFKVAGGVHYLGVNVPRTLYESAMVWIPRVGFAYSLSPNTVLRGGYGSYFNHTTSNDSGISNKDGFSRTTNSVVTNDQGVTWNLGNPAQGISPLVDPFPIRSDGTRFDVPIGNVIGKDVRLGTGFTYNNPKLQPSRHHRLRLDIQRGLGSNMLLLVSYSRSFINDLTINRGLSYVPGSYYSLSQQRNDAVYNELNKNVTNPFYIGNLSGMQTSNPQLYSLLASRSFFTSKTIKKSSLLTQYPHMQSVVMAGSPEGRHSHHSLMARFEKRFSSGWTFDTSYEFARTRNKSFLANAFDSEPQWVESDDYRPHRWTMSGIYELPFGRSKRFLNKSGWVNTLIGDWQISGVWQMQSGECIDFGDLFFYGDSYKDILVPAAERIPERWINNGWQYPTGDPRNNGVANSLFETDSRKTPAYNVRTFPSRINFLRTDTAKVLDANIQKSFRFGSDGDKKVIFRVDLLNLPNHQFWENVNTNPTSASFGKAEGLANYPRVIQFLLRLSF